MEKEIVLTDVVAFECIAYFYGERFAVPLGTRYITADADGVYAHICSEPPVFHEKSNVWCTEDDRAMTMNCTDFQKFQHTSQYTKVGWCRLMRGDYRDAIMQVVPVLTMRGKR